MHFKRKALVLFFTLLTLAFPGKALILNSHITFFSIKPVTCVVQKLGDICQLMATVEWKAQSHSDVCIRQDQTRIHCWSNTLTARDIIPIKVHDTTTFTLINQQDSVFASQEVKIIATQPVKTRRRLRASWSIF